MPGSLVYDGGGVTLLMGVCAAIGGFLDMTTYNRQPARQREGWSWMYGVVVGLE